MGQQESKRSTASVTPQFVLSPAHHPVMSSQPSVGQAAQAPPSPRPNFLGVPMPSRPRRNSDAAAEIISRSPSPRRKVQHLLSVPGDGEGDANGVVDNTRRRRSMDLSRSPSPPSHHPAPLASHAPKSPFSLKKFQKRNSQEHALPIILPGLAGVTLPIPTGGRRSRRQSSEQGPINMKTPKPIDDALSWFSANSSLPRIPAGEIYVPPTEEDEFSQPVKFRGRASTIGNGQASRLSRPQPQTAIEKAVKAAKTDRRNMLVPTVFKYRLSKSKATPKRVFIAGTMTDWRTLEMGFIKGELDFIVVIDCRPGEYYFKFCVDNDWAIDESQEVVTCAGMGRKNSFGASTKPSTIRANMITVKAEDLEVFEALACDSFAIKHIKHDAASEVWGQVKPKPETKSVIKVSERTQSGSQEQGPPILPPHLLNIMLNKETGERADPVLLPEPTSHVSLNHLYAQSIRDSMLVLASTTRYRKKCVTVVFYKPVL